ncbi:hypothetical protein [Chryseobacterium sp. HSC-36S06]|uniref:hypothetical protein n=1 Tax=Chryseobacterium sp. HSC-36S06 TaxID=2910970 RepID=UPI00209D0DBE|nr:hypothetical protein [Chryseobacterium sp. HSC-36S06]MCP2038894.1 hypothetical protein [Chryseobacterium sp. HSC-36S06]
MYQIEVQNFGDIVIRKNLMEILIVKRKTDLYGKVVSEYYTENNLIFKTISIKSIFWKLKIEEINAQFRVKEIGKYNFFKSKFICNNKEIEIIDNPFYFVNKIYSKIKFNNKTVGIVKMKNVIGANKKGNLSLNLDFIKFDQNAEFDCLLCYAITCNLLNAG